MLFRRSAEVIFRELHKQAENEDVLGIYILHKPFLHNTIPDSKKSRTDKTDNDQGF